MTTHTTPNPESQSSIRIGGLTGKTALLFYGTTTLLSGALLCYAWLRTIGHEAVEKKTTSELANVALVEPPPRPSPSANATAAGGFEAERAPARTALEKELASTQMQVARLRAAGAERPAAETARLLAAAAPKAAGEAAYTEVQIFYATDRARTENSAPDEVFGADRGEVSYGTCTVSIPPTHRIGQIERRSFWRWLVRAAPNPNKDVVLLEVNPENQDSYFRMVADRIAASHQSSALVFIHGYNVTFADAAKRTAQMTYDLDFDGAPIFYSWPSQGSTAGYPADEATVEWAQANLLKFFSDVAEKTEAENIFLVAHSMGNRAMTRALGDLIAAKPALARRYRAVILAAPDIDADVFKQQIAPRLTATGALVTLYCSSADRALELSKNLHQHQRAGDTNPEITIVDGVETIDATNADTSLLGHSRLNAPSIISDMYYLIRDGRKADQRWGLRQMTSPNGRYWLFKP